MGRTAYCGRCGERWVQVSWAGERLCVTCARAAGYLEGPARREYARHERHAPDGGAPVPAADLVPRPALVRVIGGVEFEVVWDGT